MAALLGATASVVLVVRALGVRTAYVAAAAWALVAVAARASGASAPVVAGLVVVAVAAAVVRRWPTRIPLPVGA